MKLIIPNVLRLDSCSVAESDAVDGVVWNNNTSYSENTLVRRNHVTYRSVIDNNQGNDPELTFGGDDPAWQKIIATMPYRMLDDYIETRTYAPAGQTLTFSVPFSRADSFALLNMGGDHLTIRITDNDGTEVWRGEATLTHDISDMSLFEYYFTLVNADDITVKTDVPVTVNGTMSVTITPQNNQHQPYISHVIVGRNWYVGETKFPAEIGITDFSKRTQDDFGVTTFVKRSYSRNASLSLFVRPDRMYAITKILSDLRATPIFIEGGNSDIAPETLVGSNHSTDNLVKTGEEAFGIYGWIEDWRIVYEGPNEVELRVEVQGLI